MEVFLVGCEMGIESVPNVCIISAGCQKVKLCFYLIDSLCSDGTAALPGLSVSACLCEF